MVKLCIIRFGCKTVQFSNLSLKKKNIYRAMSKYEDLK